MCGIAGIFEYQNGQAVSPELLDAMLAIIRHRGPDDQGVHLEGPLGLGMRRLSIIDLAGGHQPIFNETGDVVIVFNGEIYNYVELREDLRRRGHTFATASDTEVIVHLYEEMGTDCLQELRGMFAFALWDRRRQELFIARDRLGIKPLYYTEAGGRLIFGSEIKSILLHPAVTARLDPAALSNFLSLRYVPAPQTLFQGIHALPPGYSLICNQEGLRVGPYWDLSFPDGQGWDRSEAEYMEELEALLTESVRLRLRSDVPFGAFLSGGVDSSLVVALMSQFLDEPVKTFSVGFHSDPPGQDELPFARQVAQQFSTDHHEILVAPHHVSDLAEKVTWHLDLPLADQATLAVYMVSELAARHVKMVLSGEGGDELFAGYARYSGERFSPLFQRMPAGLRSLALGLTGRLPGLRRPKLALYALSQPDEVTRFLHWFPLFNQEMKAQLLAGGFRQRLNGGVSSDHVFGQALARTDARMPLHRMLYVDTKLWLPDYLLLRGDKMSMANSLEARVPLLDHKLVEFAAALPPHMKLRRMTRKYLLKRVASTLLPDSIVHRKKKGFPIPIYDWFRRELRPFVRDTLSPEALKRRGLFDPAYVGKLLDEHESGFADHGLLIWGLMGVEFWHRQFIDRPVRVEQPAQAIQVQG